MRLRQDRRAIAAAYEAAGQVAMQAPGHGGQMVLHVGADGNAEIYPVGGGPHQAGKSFKVAEFRNLADVVQKLRDRDPKGNQKIQEFLRTGGHGMDPAVAHWCAAFLGATIHHAGMSDIPIDKGGDGRIVISLCPTMFHIRQRGADEAELRVR